MNRRYFLTVFCLGAVTAGMAVAASFEESVIAQLRAQGYKNITVERTLLGRVKISAKLKNGHREIILNPRTGEILRDLWIGADGGASSPQIAATNPDNGSGSGDDDAEDDDDADGDGSGGDSGGDSEVDGSGSDDDDTDDDDTDEDDTDEDEPDDSDAD